MNSGRDHLVLLQEKRLDHESEATLNRRSAIRTVGGVGAQIILGGCGGKDNPNTSEGESAEESILDSPHTKRCVLTPAQVEGPFYLALTGARTKMAVNQEGIPLEINLSVVDQTCQPVKGARVEVWHADARGIYSGFSEQVVDATDQDFLRGDMISDARGQVYFRSVYPGWYPGRAVHVHFKVSVRNNMRITSQFYFPDQISRAVYQHPIYRPRGVQDTSLARDKFLQSVGQIHTNLIASVVHEHAGYLAQMRITI